MGGRLTGSPEPTVIVTVSVLQAPWLSVAVKVKASVSGCFGALKVVEALDGCLMSTAVPRICTQFRDVIQPSGSLALPASWTVLPVATLWSGPAETTGGWLSGPPPLWG